MSCVLGKGAPSSWRRALRYFSAACWQWKHTAFRGGGVCALSVLATFVSSSALLTHLPVWRLIQYLALLHDLAQEPIALLQTLLDLVGCSDMDVERERTLECQIDADRLINGITGWHDDQQIDVALGVRLAIGVGAKQNDFVGMEVFGNFANKAPNRREGDVRRSIAVWLDVACWGRSFVGHSAIVIVRCLQCSRLTKISCNRSDFDGVPKMQRTGSAQRLRAAPTRSFAF